MTNLLEATDVWDEAETRQGRATRAIKTIRKRRDLASGRGALLAGDRPAGSRPATSNGPRSHSSLAGHESAGLGFAGCASSPDMVGQTIEAALEIQGKDRFGSWRENDIAGRSSVDPILENMAASRCFATDISSLNFNVTTRSATPSTEGVAPILV